MVKKFLLHRYSYFGFENLFWYVKTTLSMTTNDIIVLSFLRIDYE